MCVQSVTLKEMGFFRGCKEQKTDSTVPYKGLQQLLGKQGNRSNGWPTNCTVGSKAVMALFNVY